MLRKSCYKLAFCSGSVIAASLLVSARDKNDIEAKEIDVNDASLYATAIQQSKRQLSLYREETGIPGISIAVEVDGKLAWSDGVGFADVENHTPCCGNTVMRIASISKPITIALIGRLWQEGLLDLDKPIHHYVPDFPPKFDKDGKQLSPTLRQLASHLGGIRHYRSVAEQRRIDSDPAYARSVAHNDSAMEEFFNMRRFSGVRESLQIFKDDELVYKPGERFLYTTYGYSLLGAAAEFAGKRPLPVLYRQLFRHLGLNSTHLDDPLMVIPNRARHYVRAKDGRLENAPYVDNSNKWAGGGLISSARDIAHFGSIMLQSYQCIENDSMCSSSYLSPSTMKTIWTPQERTHCWHANGRYALGWCVLEPPKNTPHAAHPLLDDNRPIFTHSGGAVGGTTMLLVLPAISKSFPKIAKHFSSLDNKRQLVTTVKAAEIYNEEKTQQEFPRGISVAILANLQNISGIGDLALDIALRFDRARKN